MLCAAREARRSAMDGLRKECTEADETRRTLEAFGVMLRRDMREAPTVIRPALDLKR
jgi:hypothetical protein